ncbi:extracellular solute-binding protein [Paenibacillus sp. 2KB_22]|uniref:extracellular solute-binding protein n=1 Tax=Paenibacillus sp. 2KB_22 TaxID=3232978 RepID=UPI003F9A9BA4
MGQPPASGLDNFYKELDALTTRDFGMIIRFDYIPWGEEKSRIGRAIASKSYDFYIGGYWTNFKEYAKKKAFVDLTPLLDSVPKLVEHYGNTLNQVKLDGKIYGLPTIGKPGAGGFGVFYREDLRQLWHLPLIKDLKSLEEYMYKAKEVYTGTPMINDKRYGDVLWEMMTGGTYFTLSDYAVVPVNDPYTVINKYETPEYRELLEKTKQWYDDGIVDREILARQTNETTKTLELMKADLKPIEFNNHFSAISRSYIGVLKERYPANQYGWFDYRYELYPDTIFMPNITLDSTMISIGSHSQHAQLALKFLEKAHTDQTYYNLLQYGVEGENYHLVDGMISYEGILDQNKKLIWPGLSDGYMDLPIIHPDEWQPIVNDLVYTKGAELAKRNGEDPHAGFMFDTSDVNSELNAMEAVKAQYIQPLAVGVSHNVENDLHEVNEQLMLAGIEKYLAELQQQLNQYAYDKTKH